MKIGGIALVLGLVSLVSCSGGSKSTADGGLSVGGTGAVHNQGDAMTTGGSAGRGGRGSGGGGGSPISSDLDGGDAADAARANTGTDSGCAVAGGCAEVLVCSASPLDGAQLHSHDGGGLCSTNDACEPVASGDHSCWLSWGCGSYDSALAAVCADAGADSGFGFVSFTTERWGFLIIQGGYGLSTVRAYYDKNSGALVGTWEQDDLGYQGCSGTIPKGQYADDFLTGQGSLCGPHDSGIADPHD
ncbi:MAG TPA: hypothetical protein VL137_13870 [Polyangiaceae bacterium]|nr:hypothetical protein [Polyangiaceae bacterium]